jgi:phosphonate transport system substrate-binding protein
MFNAFKIGLLLVALAGSLTSTADTISFGIVPQQSASKLAETWSPVADYLSRKTGQEVRFATAPDIPAFERRLADGEYDLAYMNPYHFVVFNERPGYVALTHASDKKIRGILVVRKDSGIDSLEQLAGQRLAFPAPAAFAASILTRAALAEDGITIEANYVSSHDSVYRTVEQGIFVAGGGVMRTFNNMAPEIRDQLRILWRTEGFTPHAVASHPTMQSDTRNALQAALLEMSHEPEGRQLLAAMGINGWQAADDSDWDDVRGLKLKQLEGLSLRENN